MVEQPKVLSWCSWQYVDRLGKKGPIGTRIHSFNGQEGFANALEQALNIYGRDEHYWVRSWVESITLEVTHRSRQKTSYR